MSQKYKFFVTRLWRDPFVTLTNSSLSAKFCIFASDFKNRVLVLYQLIIL